MSKSRTIWTLAITGTATFMAGLDNLVVTTALPSIKTDLGAGIEELEWTVNGYTLTYAVLLMLGAALGDRFGRRRIFTFGIVLFTAASAGAAIAPNTGALIAARAVQGIGAAALLPLSLTLLTAAVPPARRALALGVWGGINGLSIAVGPLVGGAIVEHGSWQWIFWLNVPIGIALLPLVRTKITESRGPNSRLDVTGTLLVSLGLLGIVYGLVSGEGDGWTSLPVAGSLLAGAAFTAAFVSWERRTAQPMLPLHFFKDRTVVAVNLSGLLMFAGVFGSIFLLTQFLQNVQGYSPLEAGVRTLPWTAMPVVVAPLTGIFSARIGSKPLVVAGLALLAAGLTWFALIVSPDVSYAAQVPALLLCGTGMALYFAPTANLLMGAVQPGEQGVASGANNAFRELGGVLGVAVLASVFSSYGGFTTPQVFVDGLVPALWVGAAATTLAAVFAVTLPRQRTKVVATADEPKVPVAV
jgi:EmrB/QacA subfamily drug resistance transporter